MKRYCFLSTECERSHPHPFCSETASTNTVSSLHKTDKSNSSSCKHQLQTKPREYNPVHDCVIAAPSPFISQIGNRVLWITCCQGIQVHVLVPVPSQTQGSLISYIIQKAYDTCILTFIFIKKNNQTKNTDTPKIQSTITFK